MWVIDGGTFSSTNENFLHRHGETAVMKFHHILTCTGLFYYSFKISKQFFIVYAIGLTEITNPLLQIRWFLKHHGLREGIAFRIVEPLFIGMFFFIRVFVLSYYLYEAWFNKDLKFDGQDLTFTTLGACTGYALAFQMFNYIRYQLKKSQKKKVEIKEQ
jgi:TLC domain